MYQELENPAFSVVTLVLCVFSAILDATVLWKQIIQRNGGIITNALNISCLAKVTDGFTQGHIVQVVKGVLTDRRIHRQNYKPLVAAEFMAALTRMSPVYQEEEESFKVNGTPVWPCLSHKHLSHDLPLWFLSFMNVSYTMKFGNSKCFDHTFFPVLPVNMCLPNFRKKCGL